MFYVEHMNWQEAVCVVSFPLKVVQSVLVKLHDSTACCHAIAVGIQRAPRRGLFTCRPSRSRINPNSSKTFSL